MEKQPFTPSGVLALQEWLYQLPQTEFDAEILAMQTNFEAWSLAHLELDSQQLTFYKELNVTAKNNLAYNITLASAYKKPISLTQEVLRSSVPEPESDKLFKPKSSLAITSDGEGNYEVDGEVVIEVNYIS